MYTLGLYLGFGHIPLVAWNPDKSIRMLESSGYGAYPLMLGEKFDYYNTIFDPTSPLTYQPYTNYADLQRLTYSSDSLDVVIASDVFEHVREDAKGFQELYRVLKRGGLFIMTVPYHHDMEQTIVRVEIDGNRDIHMLPPEYHGGGEQMLAYRIYGRDLFDCLRSVGFGIGYLETELPEYGIGNQYVFVAIKDSAIDLGKFHFMPNSSQWKDLKVSPLILFRLSVAFKYNWKSFRVFASALLQKLRNLSGSK